MYADRTIRQQGQRAQGPHQSRCPLAAWAQSFSSQRASKGQSGSCTLVRRLAGISQFLLAEQVLRKVHIIATTEAAVATRATPTMLQFANDWAQLFDSAVLAGIVGDLSHTQRGGYHISIDDQINDDNYSVVRPDDAAPPGTWPRDCASAVDMNLALSDMKVCHKRLVTVWRNRATDPRAKYINGHNGWDGEDSPGRYDWVTGAVYPATLDHRWHVHLEWRRRYVNNPMAADAVLSILRGETAAAYLGEDTMTAEEFLAILENDDVAATLKRYAGQGVHSQRLGRSDETIGQDLQGDDNAEILLKLDEISERIAAVEQVIKTPGPES